jgi:pimeloyl-ACP methyl ester carboxylesterase
MTALELDRPILIGCSIGGRIALHLALEHPQEFRAIIGLQTRTPEETLGVASSVQGCEVTIMKGLGHFPMSENPTEFLKHLLPVLEKIKGR